MEITLNKQSCQDIVMAQGWDTFLKALDDYTGRKLDLYTVSTDWFGVAEEHQPVSGFICKAKGARGDLIVRWA